MPENDPTATVRRMFAAFASGDLDAVLETLHKDSHWTYIGANPDLVKAEFRGTAEVRRFFEHILETYEITAFNPDEWIEQGDAVVVLGSEEGRIRATGAPFRHEWSQRYVVTHNLISRMTEYNIRVEPKG